MNDKRWDKFKQKIDVLVVKRKYSLLYSQLRICNDQLACFNRFVKWPALIESWQRDANYVRSAINRCRHNPDFVEPTDMRTEQAIANGIRGGRPKGTVIDRRKVQRHER